MKIDSIDHCGYVGVQNSEFAYDNRDVSVHPGAFYLGERRIKYRAFA